MTAHCPRPSRRPGNSPADAEVETGDRMGFDGTLLRVDRFSRAIYVAEGALR
ncbi:MAG: hypothetical protein P8N02_03690 [Actinomycetota bacterium]|nr:hypothetical protein [Actinomycetota bacterium]